MADLKGKNLLPSGADFTITAKILSDVPNLLKKARRTGRRTTQKQYMYVPPTFFKVGSITNEQ